MAAPTLHLQYHENGAEARLLVPDMPLAQRLALLLAALGALTTGRFCLNAAHVKTVHQGHLARLALHYADASRNNG